jgi:hypothetical protein
MAEKPSEPRFDFLERAGIAVLVFSILAFAGVVVILLYP